MRRWRGEADWVEWSGEERNRGERRGTEVERMGGIELQRGRENGKKRGKKEEK